MRVSVVSPRACVYARVLDADVSLDAAGRHNVPLCRDRLRARAHLPTNDACLKFYDINQTP